jgi:hypothetical protein
MFFTPNALATWLFGLVGQRTCHASSDQNLPIVIKGRERCRRRSLTLTTRKPHFPVRPPAVLQCLWGNLGKFHELGGFTRHVELFMIN